MTPSIRCDRRASRSKTVGLTLVLYLAILSVDAIRKIFNIPSGAVGVIYLLTTLIYIYITPSIRRCGRIFPRYLPLCLILLSLWCTANALLLKIPAPMAVLGWTSYVFFVPLFYVGVHLMANDLRAAKVLRIAVLAGALVGLGAIAGALFGVSAPRLLQPIIPAVGVHSFNDTTVYLAPSLFADGEQASEQLLVALFAWLAFAYLPSRKLRRLPSSLPCLLILGGLIAAERRVAIYAAVAGLAILLILGQISVPTKTMQMASSRTATARSRRLGSALLLAVVGSIALVSFLGASKFLSFLTAGSPGSRLSLMVSVPTPDLLVGQGTGSSTLGANVVGAVPFTAVNATGTYDGFIAAGREFITTEGGLTKTWLELGILGFILYGLTFFSVLARLMSVLPRADGVGRALTILTMVLGIIFFKNHQSLDDPLTQPLFWLCAGGAWARIRISGPAWNATTERMLPAASNIFVSRQPISPQR